MLRNLPFPWFSYSLCMTSMILVTLFVALGGSDHVKQIKSHCESGKLLPSHELALC